MPTPGGSCRARRAVASCAFSRPANRILDVVLREAERLELLARGIGLLQPDRRQHDLYMLDRDVILVGFAHALDDGPGQGDLVLARPLGHHDRPRKVMK